MNDIIICAFLILLSFEFMYNTSIKTLSSFNDGYNFAKEQYLIHGDYCIDSLEALYNPFDTNDFSSGVLHFLRTNINEKSSIL